MRGERKSPRGLQGQRLQAVVHSANAGDNVVLVDFAAHAISAGPATQSRGASAVAGYLAGGSRHVPCASVPGQQRPFEGPGRSCKGMVRGLAKG